MEELLALFNGKEWFHSVGTDEFGRHVVYINHITAESLNDVPDYVDGKQVVVHFAACLDLSRDKFVQTPQPYVQQSCDESAVDIAELVAELKKLEYFCGDNVLQDIFFEVHDMNNKVTNYGDKYPSIYKSMIKLYNKYGFDLIYEQVY